ncbi:MAG TPA: Zn-ribbon domain-containing OB-fold protein [Chloroflexi bacterium]|nr:Zn-ribbon domain-containing OB-fold protein [Chloroflexota bacterium]
MKEYVYDSVYLRSKDFEEGNVLFETWDPNARYAWDAGVAIGRYLQGLKAGQLIGRHCPECDRVLIPPRMFCETCFRPTDRWVELEDTGAIITFSRCYVTWDMIRITDPQIPAVIEIDGASPGMGIMHMLSEVDPDEVQIGMRVQAVWKPAAERIGAITDIAYFKPL